MFNIYLILFFLYIDEMCFFWWNDSKSFLFDCLFVFFILYIKGKRWKCKKINRKIEVKKELCVFSYIVGLVEGEIFLLDDIFY